MGINPLIASFLAMRQQQQSEAEWQRQQALDAAEEAYRQAALQHNLQSMDLRKQESQTTQKRLAYEMDPSSPENRYRAALAEDIPARRRAEEEKGKREEARLTETEKKNDWSQFMDAYLRSGLGLGSAWSLSGMGREGQPIPQDVLDKVTEEAIRQGLLESNVQIPDAARQDVGGMLSLFNKILGFSPATRPAPGGMGPPTPLPAGPSDLELGNMILPASAPKSREQLQKEATALPAPEFARKQQAEARLLAESQARIADLQAKEAVAKQKADAYMLSITNTKEFRDAMTALQRDKLAAQEAWHKEDAAIKRYISETGRINSITGQGRLNDQRQRTVYMRERIRDARNLRGRLGKHWPTILSAKMRMDAQEQRLVKEQASSQEILNGLQSTVQGGDITTMDPFAQEKYIAAQSRLKAATETLNALRQSEVYRDINGADADTPGLYRQYQSVFQSPSYPGHQPTTQSGKVKTPGGLSKELTPDLMIHFLQAATQSNDKNVWRRPESIQKAKDLARRRGFLVP